MSLFHRTAFFILLAAPAMAAPVKCPPSVAVTQTISVIPMDMQAMDAEPMHRWTNVQFSDGHPKDQAWLAPDSSKPSGKTFTNVWTFGASPEGTWMSCNYAGTSTILFYRLPAAIKSCSVRYDASMSPAEATAIDCR